MPDAEAAEISLQVTCRDVIIIVNTGTVYSVPEVTGELK